MQTVQYSDLRQHLAENLDRTYNDHTPLLITRKNGKNAVLMAYEDFKAIEETFYLLSNPHNAQHLLESIKEAKAGRLIHQDIVE